jgi:hypothetical protein
VKVKFDTLQFVYISYKERREYRTGLFSSYSYVVLLARMKLKAALCFNKADSFQLCNVLHFLFLLHTS